MARKAAERVTCGMCQAAAAVMSPWGSLACAAVPAPLAADTSASRIENVSHSIENAILASARPWPVRIPVRWHARAAVLDQFSKTANAGWHAHAPRPRVRGGAGRNVIAGTYRGHGEVIAYFTRRRHFAGNTPLATDAGFGGCCDKLSRAGWADEPRGNISCGVGNPPRDERPPVREQLNPVGHRYPEITLDDHIPGQRRIQPQQALNQMAAHIHRRSSL